MDQGNSRPLVFTATGGAYFRIWIVNLLLSIITIGIYSPWAKVRRIRYFYGNTLFDGSPFEFHGRPLALLYGRLIGLVLLIAYTQAAKFSLTLWLVVVAVLIVLFPWLLWKSLRFRLANSSYRGIHFGFDGSVGDAYLTFVPMMLGVLAPTFVLLVSQHAMTLGARPSYQALGTYFVASGIVIALAPWFYFRLRAYQHRHARLGMTPFSFDGRVISMYAIAGKSILIVLLFAILGGVAGGVVGGLSWLFVKQAGATTGGIGAFAVGGAVFYLMLLSASSCTKAMIQNFVWGHSRLDGVPFTSGVGLVKLWWIEFVNLVLTLITLGFFWPFAVVRSMRYRVQSVRWSGDSDGLIAHALDARVGATGEETADLFGLDLAL